MKKTIIMMGLVSALGILTGCSSTSTIKEFDANGNLIKETTTKESVVEQVIASTKDKTVIAFREAYFVGMRAEPSTETLFNLECAYFHKNTGVISVLKEQQNLDKISDIVKGMKDMDAVSITTTGVSSGDAAATSSTSSTAATASSTSTSTATDTTAATTATTN